MNTTYSTDTASQRQHILAYLIVNIRITTLEARQKLDVLHPAARIMELRKAGINIMTYWRTVDTGKAKHRVAEYVLLAETSHE